jgi:CTP synthase
VAGLQQAGHTEVDPDTAVPLLVPAACPVDSRPAGAPRLWGALKIKLAKDSLAGRVYDKEEISERFTCSYEMNEQYRGRLEKAGLKVSGRTMDGGSRIIELPDHRFFIATGFVPQLSSAAGRPHPLVTAFLKAALQGRQK